jgi:hypothetical protein
VLFVAQTCARGPRYLEVIFPTLVACVVLWSNHVARAPLLTARAVLAVAGRSLYDFVGLVVLLFLASIPLTMVTGIVDCYTDRSLAAEVLLSGSILRSEVEANAKRAGTLDGSGRGVSFTPTRRAHTGKVMTDGTIIVIGDDPPVVFLLTPNLSAGAITWKCRGYPERIAPRMCTDGHGT